MTAAELRAQAEAAMRPCAKCDLTVPHAFEDPDSHTWDPNHMTVRPSDVISALDDATEAAARAREALHRLPRFGVVDGVVTPHPKGTLIQLDAALAVTPFLFAGPVL